MHSASPLRICGGAVAIVRGGASGIGRALSETLARRGATVVLADLQVECAQEVAAAIRASGGNAAAAEGDVTDFDALKRIVESTVNTHGRLGYLFKTAGVRR